jgi:hypothetical protein
MQLMQAGGPVVRASGSGNKRYEDEYIRREGEQYDISVSEIPVFDDVTGSFEGGYAKTTLDPKFLPPHLREEMVFQQRRVGGGLRYQDDEGRGIGFMMRRMSGTNMPALVEGEMQAQLPVAGGVLSLRAAKPLDRGAEPRYNMQYTRKFAEGGEASSTKQDPRTTALDARILKLAGLPPMDPSQYDQSVAKQVYRILGRANG